jgi:hypothetical protein
MGNIDDRLYRTFKAGTGDFIEKHGNENRRYHSQGKVHQAYLNSIPKNRPEPGRIKQSGKVGKSDEAGRGKYIVPVKGKPYPQNGEIMKQYHKNKRWKEHEIKIKSFSYPWQQFPIHYLPPAELTPQLKFLFKTARHS